MTENAESAEDQESSEEAFPKVPQRSRYLGTRSFELEDAVVFHGRREEADELFYTISQKRLTVLSGVSGIGKTSLLQAAIFPRLEERGMVVLTCRLGRSPDRPEVTSEEVCEYFAARFEESCPDDIEFRRGELSSLWAFLKTTTLWKEGKLLDPIFIFDQLEEIFTLLSPKARDLVVREMAPVIRGVPTASVQELLEQDPPPFTDTPPSAKMVFGIREEFIGQLKQFRDHLPEVFENIFVLQPLTYDQARDAIEKPALEVETDTSFQSPRFHWSERELDRLLAFLSGDEELASSSDDWKTYARIEPFPLQILCSRVEEQISELGETYGGLTQLYVPASFLGGVSGMKEVIADHYRAELDRFSEGGMSKKIQRMVDEGLITSDERRTALPEDIIIERFEVPEEILSQLCERHLLRKDLVKGIPFYELSHDRLITPALKARPLRIPKNLRKRLVVGGTIAGLCILGLLIFSAVVSRSAAEAKSEAADAARKEAEAKAEAVAAAEEAIEAKEKALEEQDNALLAQRAELDEQRSQILNANQKAQDQLAAIRIELEQKNGEIAGLEQELEGLRQRVKESNEPSQDMAKRFQEEQEVNRTLASRFELLQQEELSLENGLPLLEEYLKVLRSSPVLLLGMENYTDDSLVLLNERADQASQLYATLAEISRKESANDVVESEQLGRDLLGAIDVLWDRAEFVELSDGLRLGTARGRILSELANHYWFMGDRKYGEVIAELRSLQESGEAITVQTGETIAVSYFHLEEPDIVLGGDQTFSLLQGIREKLSDDSDALRRNLEMEFRLRMARVTRSMNQFIPSYGDEGKQTDVEEARAAYEELLRIIPEPRSSEDTIRIALMQAKLDVRSDLKDAFLIHRSEFASLDPEFLRDGDIPSALLYADFRHWQGLMATKGEGETYFREAYQTLISMDRQDRLPAHVEEKLGVITSLMSRLIGPNGEDFLEIPRFPKVYLSEQELTIGAYRRFVEATGHVSARAVVNLPVDGVWTYQGDAAMNWEELAEAMGSTDEMPVSGVSFEDAKAYCQWLTVTERARSGGIGENEVYRLPRDSEWEAAAVDDLGRVPFHPWRRSNPFGFPEQSDIGVENLAGQETNENGLQWKLPEKFASLKAFINYYRDRHVFLAPVKEYQRNAFGFFDMGGNVQELTAGDTSGLPLIRGGSFIDADLESIRLDLPHANDASNDTVWIHNPEHAWSWVGFRVAYERTDE